MAEQNTRVAGFGMVGVVLVVVVVGIVGLVGYHIYQTDQIVDEQASEIEAHTTASTSQAQAAAQPIPPVRTGDDLQKLDQTLDTTPIDDANLSELDI